MKLKKPTIFITTMWLVLLLAFTSTSFAQTPTIPTDAATGVAQSTTDVSWTTFGSGTFDVEFNGIDNTYAVSVSAATATTALNFAHGRTLLYNTTYYWQVREHVTSPATSTWQQFSFTTQIATPVITAPTTGAAGISVNPTITWTFAGGTTGVTFDIKYGSLTEVTGLSGTTTSYTFATQLSDNTTYIFKVIANKTASSESTNNSVTATTGAAYPLISPGNTITGISVMPTFEWTGTATNYSIELSTSTNFSSPIASIAATGNVTTYTAQETDTGFPLSNGIKYYWRVNNGTVYSEIYSFTTTANISLTQSVPANGAKVYTYDPLMFTWYGNSGGTRFVLQITQKDGIIAPFANEWAASTTIKIDNISNMYKTVTGLSGGLRYWWRLIAYEDTDADGAYDASIDKTYKYSSQHYFDTQGGAVKATPSNPVGGNKVYTLTPMFGWYTTQYEPSATFQIIVATSNTTNGSGALTTGILGTYPSSSTSNMYYTIPDGALSYSTTYHWQVKTTYGSSTTYSDVASFVTFDDASAVVNKPVPSYPTGGYKIYTQNPTISWYGNAYNSTISYEVFFSITGETGGYSSWGTVVSDQFLDVGPLIAGQTYWWHVIATGSTTKTSSNASFAVAGGGSSSAIVSYPKNNALVYTTTPILSWYREGSDIGWSNYKVKWHIGTSINWKTGAATGTTTTDINTTIFTMTTALDYGATYYWAVALYDGTTVPDDASYSEGSFIVYGGASSLSVVQTTPGNNATGVSLSPTVYWYVMGTSPNITGYTVDYTPYLNHSNQVQVTTTTETFAVLPNLSPGTTYSWRVNVNLTSGGPVQSGWRTFTTVATTAPIQPMAGSPINNVQIEDSSPQLTWYLPVQPLEGQNYTVEVADNPDFANAQTIENVDASAVQLQSLSEGQYYWRVKGKNSNGESYFSNDGQFRIGSITAVDDEKVIPTEYKLSQNYPNPFNPSTVIEYSLPEASYVSMKIYNVLGREVRVLVNENQNAGSYQTQWNGLDNVGNKVATGMYIYRITTGNFVATKKMLLLK